MAAGSRVASRYYRGAAHSAYFPGVVAAANGDATVDIDFDAGGSEHGVAPQFVRPLAYTGQPAWSPDAESMPVLKQKARWYAK